MMTGLRCLVPLLLCAIPACSGVIPAVEKLDSGPQDTCFTHKKTRCAAMTVCTTHIAVCDRKWECDELDLNRNGRVDCLDDAELFACNEMLLEPSCLTATFQPGEFSPPQR